MLIRRYLNSDYAKIVPLIKNYIKELTQYGNEMVVAQNTIEYYFDILENGITLVAEESDDLIGFAMAHKISIPYDNNLGKVAFGNGTWISPNFRGRDISKELRDELVKILKENEYDSIIGAVNFGNEIAIESMKRYGFRPLQWIGIANLKEIQ